MIVIYHFIFIILLFITYHLSFFIYYLSFITYYLLLVLFLFIYHYLLFILQYSHWEHFTGARYANLSENCPAVSIMRKVRRRLRRKEQSTPGNSYVFVLARSLLCDASNSLCRMICAYVPTFIKSNT